MNSFVHYSKCLFLMIIFFNQLIVGQLVDIAFHNALLINDKLYFLGGYSESSNSLTNQLIYLDLSKTFKINNGDSNGTSLPIKTTSPNSPPPPFSSAAVVLGRGVKDDGIIYLIGGNRNNPYGNLAYSIDSKFLNTWRPLNINNDAAVLLGLPSSMNTIFAQDDSNKVYVLGGSGGSNFYDIDLNIMNITVIGQNIINPTSYPMFFTSHIMNNKNMIFIGKDLTQLSIFNIDEDTWTTVNAIGDKPSQRSIRHSSILTSDGRIIVYGGTLEDDKLAVLDTTNFQWTIPKNIVYPVNGHYGHSATLYRDNYMIIAFGRRLTPAGYVYDSNILMLDISDKNNYKWLDSFDPLPEAPPTTSNNGNNTLLILRIVLGATSALALVILGIYLIVRYNRKKRQNTVSPQIAVKPENNKDENEKVVVIGINNGDDDVSSKKDDKDTNNSSDSKDIQKDDQ